MMPGLALAICLAAVPPAPVVFPDGLIARVASIERLADSAGAQCAATCAPGVGAGLTLVRVTIALGLPATAPGAIRLDVVAGSAGGVALLVGAAPAAIDCGYVGEPVPLCTDSAAVVPTIVAPGAEVLISESFDVPSAALDGPLSVVVQPPVSDRGRNPLSPVTFADAGSLLH